MQNLFTLLSGLLNFLDQVKIEGKRVNWPSREKTIKNTVIVIVFALVIALILSTFDVVFQCVLSLAGIGVCVVSAL